MLLTFQIPGASSRSAHHRPSGAAFAFSAKAVTPALYVAYPPSSCTDDRLFGDRLRIPHIRAPHSGFFVFVIAVAKESFATAKHVRTLQPAK